AVGIGRIDDDRGDLLGILEPGILPGLATIGRLVEPVADGEIGALQTFAGADVNDVGIGRAHRKVTDGTGWLIIEDGIPGAAVVGGLPGAAVVDAEEEDVGPGRDADRADGSSGAEGSDAAPAHALVHGG